MHGLTGSLNSVHCLDHCYISCVVLCYVMLITLPFPDSKLHEHDRNFFGNKYMQKLAENLFPTLHIFVCNSPEGSTELF